MRVLLVNSTSRGGGAALAMRNLHDGLVRSGTDSHVAEEEGIPDDPRYHQLPGGWRGPEWLTGAVTWRLGLSNCGRLGTFRLPRQPWFQQAALVNFHNLHGSYFNFLALPSLTRRKPAVLTLHDMWSFTGHCVYSFDCERWQGGCGSCPYPETYQAVRRDATALELRLKRWAFEGSNLHLVAISRWIGGLVEKSILGRLPIHHIPNGIDLDLWKPRSRLECRAELGLPMDRPVILYAAAQLDDPRKGFDLLADALARLPERIRSRVLLMVMGTAAPGLLDALPVETKSLGFITEVPQKATVYGAADVFAFPTRADNLPLVLQESMACGTPMVSFAVGGVTDLVRDDDTGFAAPPEDVETFANLLSRLLDDRVLLQRLSRRCRAVAEAEYSIHEQVRRYRNLFESIAPESTAA